LREAAEADAAAEDARIRSDPLVAAAFSAFPEAELIGTEGNVARAARPPWS
jgi:DNA polymerase-3 subunit gamma/tau